MKGHAITFADERPVERIPDIACWSENYAFVGYDYENRIGFAAYVGRWVKNPSLWREQLYLYLPDGTALLHMAIGPAADGKVPSGGAMQFHCVEPGGRWRIVFDGAMRHERIETLLREPIVESRPHPVKCEIVLDHVLPVWMLPASENSSHGKFHYEQMGVCAGHYHFNGTDYRFAGPAYRDHSRGPRHLGGYQGHVWLQIHFKDRPIFASYQAWASNDGKLVKILDESVSMRPDGFGPASLHTHLRLETIDALFDPITLDVTVEGRRCTLRGRPLATLVASLTEEFDFFFGFPRSMADLVATEQPLLFDSEDGQVTGYIQRSLRLQK